MRPIDFAAYKKKVDNPAIVDALEKEVYTYI